MAFKLTKVALSVLALLPLALAVPAPTPTAPVATPTASATLFLGSGCLPSSALESTGFIPNICVGTVDDEPFQSYIIGPLEGNTTAMECFIRTWQGPGCHGEFGGFGPLGNTESDCIETGVVGGDGSLMLVCD